jgi:RNA polymerase sigma-70 factor (ECF subfamily)
VFFVTFLQSLLQRGRQASKPASNLALHLICYEEDSLGTTSLYDLASATNLSMHDALAVSEAHLLSAAKRGQQAAFGKLCERHAKRIYHTTLRVTRSREDAEDALQDSFLSAFVHLRDFDGRSSFSTWLTRIAINAALMKLRKIRGSREIPMDELAGRQDTSLRFDPAGWHADPEENYARQERQSVIVGAVRGLRPSLRNVIEIRELQQSSIRETAERLGISLAAAKGRLFHAKAALRKTPRLRELRRAQVRRAA